MPYSLMDGLTGLERRAIQRKAMAGRDPDLSDAEREAIRRRAVEREQLNQAVEQGVGEAILGGPKLLAEGGYELATAGSIPKALSGSGKMLGGGVGMLPVLGPIARAVAPAVKPIAVTAGGLLGGLSAMPRAGEAQSTLSRGQQRKQEMIDRDAERRRTDESAASDRSKAEADAAARRDAEREDKRLEAARRNEAERARIAREGKSADAAERERLAGVERNKTFAQKYPEWADALPGIGIGVAAGIPFAGKWLAQGVRNAPMRAWDQAVSGAESAASKGNVPGLNSQLAKLDQYNTSYPKGELPTASQSWAPTATAAGFGAGASMEARSFPDQWNAYNLPPANPERQASIDRMLDLPTLAKFGLIGAGTGASGYKAGSWLRPDARGPIEASRGMTSRYGTGQGDQAAETLTRDAWRGKELDSIGRVRAPAATMEAPQAPGMLSDRMPRSQPPEPMPARGLLEDLPPPVTLPKELPVSPPTAQPASPASGVVTALPPSRSRFGPQSYGIALGAAGAGSGAAAGGDDPPGNMAILAAMVRAGLLPPSIMSGVH